jgi:UDPglucose 6-dehydrogenase
MNLAIIGTGYVGLVTGTCFAEMGNDVICIDIDEDKVDKLRNGVVPIFEPHLDVYLERNIRQNRLSFSTELAEGVNGAEIIFLALPTPPGEDGSADLSYVLNAAKEIGKLIKEYKVIVTKSTVPVGTAEKVREAVAENCNCDFDVVSNPEFLREGFAVDDFMKPDRVVVGTSSEKAASLMKDLYAPFLRQGNPIFFMDERSAELTKYAANAFLATKITFMNEIANLCEKVGANVDEVRIGIGSDSRIGKRFLFPGIGFGGSCFPKDVSALSKTAEDHDYHFKILDAVIEVNEKQKVSLFTKMSEYFNGSLTGKHIACWGLSFKPDTDDIREAPALQNIRMLLKAGARITVYDPVSMENVKREFNDSIKYAADAYDAIDGVDALLISTEWSVFRTPDFIRMRELMNNASIFDGRNLYEPGKMKELGFYYSSIGRTVANPNK